MIPGAAGGTVVALAVRRWLPCWVSFSVHSRRSIAVHRASQIAAAMAGLLLAFPTLPARAEAGPAAPALKAAVAVVAADSGDSSATGVEALTRNAVAAGLRAGVLELALKAHARATAAGETASPLLTVIDYSLLSRERRLWVLDLDSGAVLARELVAHGNGTGGDAARHFSNRPGSYQSSLGTFVTGATYHGKHGRSLRLRGLDRGLNDKAEARAIVVHGARYVSEDIVGQLGRLGRSQGCPALSEAAAPRIIDLIQGRTVVFSYFPDPRLESTLAAS